MNGGGGSWRKRGGHRLRCKRGEDGGGGDGEGISKKGFFLLQSTSSLQVRNTGERVTSVSVCNCMLVCLFGCRSRVFICVPCRCVWRCVRGCTPWAEVATTTYPASIEATMFVIPPRLCPLAHSVGFAPKKNAFPSL